MSSSVKRSLRRSAVGVLLSALLLCLAACAGGETEAPELLEPRGVALDTAAAALGTIERTAVYEGLVLPGVRELSFSATGLVAEVSVCAGSRVRAGDVLARLDVSYSESALASQEAYLAYAEENEAILEREQEIQIELARLELEDLRASGAGQSRVRLAELKIAEKENSLAETRAIWELDHAEQQRSVEELRSTVARGALIAPCDGTVVSCTAAAGGYAMENACVVLLAEDAALYISVAAVSAADLSAASEVYATVNGQRVEVARRENGELYAARKDASAFEITDDGGHPVESGMAAVLFVISDRTENALIVPSSALHHDSGPFVYKVVDGVQVRQSVTVGVENDAEVQILSGLQEGDLVYAGT